MIEPKILPFDRFSEDADAAGIWNILSITGILTPNKSYVLKTISLDFVFLFPWAYLINPFPGMLSANICLIIFLI